MTDSETISGARYLEALKWARKGYRLERYNGPVAMTDAERTTFVRTGEPPTER